MLKKMVCGDAVGAGRISVMPLMTVRRESTRGCVRYEPRVLKVLELIRREACNGLRARDVVKTMCGSRRLAELRFRETFGHSILDEINSVRMDRVFQMVYGLSRQQRRDFPPPLMVRGLAPDVRYVLRELNVFGNSALHSRLADGKSAVRGDALMASGLPFTLAPTDYDSAVFELTACPDEGK